MRCNEAGIDIIKRYEGLRLRPYLCPAGVWTIGYGHTAGVGEKTPRITEPEADELLRRDLRRTEEGVARLFSVPLSENQFSALVSFAFNVGVGALQGSTLRTCINRKDTRAAAAEFARWNKANGKVLAGLTKRREEERALFLLPALVKS